MDRAGANTVMADYRLKERSTNFSKEEVNRLQLLVDKHKNVIMSKKTDGSSAKQKDLAWHSIEKQFNAIGQTPRTIKQLKYKFENMKRCAKKEACRERQAMIQTGGGKPPSLPPQSEEATDWLRSIMSGSIDGNEAVYDDDVMNPNSHSTPKQKTKQNDDDDDFLSRPKKAKLVINIDDIDENMSIAKIAELDVDEQINSNHNNQIDVAEAESAPSFDQSTPHSSLRKPVAPQLKRMLKKKQSKGGENVIKQALREKKLSVLEGLHDLELEKIRQTINQQKELHEQLMRRNEEKHKLEILKLQLEIELIREKKAREDMDSLGNVTKK